AWRFESEMRGRESVDEGRETGLRFVNPSLVIPLEDVWIKDKARRAEEYPNGTANGDGSAG
ncbi:hypothetical protein LTS18_011474, partial [Coniosporium uncinatum]